MKIDAIFSGGGVKSYAYIGALIGMKKHNLTLERVAGTSAGAIIAGFLAADYQVDELETILKDLDLKVFLDPPAYTKFIPFSKWYDLYKKMGIYKGDRLEAWIAVQLAKKGVHTFSDLKQGYLKVVVSDITLGKLIVIPDDLERVYGVQSSEFSVATAIRMSAGFPYFFMPKKMHGKKDCESLMIDGGLLSNFPMWIFDKGKRKKRPILGVKLSENQNDKSWEIKNAFEMFRAMFSTMKLAHDSRYIYTSDKDNIIFIPVKNVETTDFYISDETKDYLIKTGVTSTDAFLQNWST